uniref:Odorant receptor n=1 Tax=Rhabditophanes sp. KR3021 TaxID=114890 RepID=A0AC35U5M6_9BILA
MRDIYEKASTNPISNESVANLNKFVCFINNIAGIIFVVCSYIGQFVNKDVLGIVHLDLDIFTEIEQNAVMLVTYSMLYIALNSIYTKIAFTKMSFQLTNFDIDAVQISEPKNNYYIHCTLCGISKATIMRTHFEKIASAEISPRIVGKCKHKFNERDTDSWAIVWITSKIPIIILKRNVTVRNIKFGRALHSTADLIQFVVESVLIWLPIAGISVLSYTAYCIGDYETILKEIRRFYMWAMKIEVE